jgi:hypothetical protein
MPLRVTSVWRRLWWVAVITLGAAWLALVIFSGLHGTGPLSIVGMSVLPAGLIALGVRGVRSATLIVSPYRVTARELALTRHWSWPVIEGFVTETRLTRVPWLPVMRLRRRVLGVRHSGGRVCWLPELSCRVRDRAPSWVDSSAARLNDLVRLPELAGQEAGDVRSR